MVVQFQFIRERFAAYKAGMGDPLGVETLKVAPQLTLLFKC